MRTTMLIAVAAAVLLPFSAGCSQNSQVVRGQGPSVAQTAGEECVYEDEYCPVDEDCEPGNTSRKCKWCHGHGCRNCCLPYSVPNDLVYPPAGDVPAIVQYPYYTCKGPDCFFHK